MSIIAKKFLKKIRYLLEAGVVYLLYYFFYILPIDQASNIAGWIACNVGTKLRVSNIARKNLLKCFPQMSEAEMQDIIKKMWNNLGRIIGELPHWYRLDPKEFDKRLNFVKTVKKPERSALLLSGHFGNFELAAKLCKTLSEDVKLIYRPANNPFVDALINRVRLKNGLTTFAKGKAGLKQIFAALLKGGVIGMMVDQKMNDGIEVPFFGMPARTTNLPAKLALKFNIPIYMGKVKRIKGAYYQVEVDALKITPSDDVTSLTCKINDIIERWIRESPEQWFWVHRRWEKN